MKTFFIYYRRSLFLLYITYCFLFLFYSSILLIHKFKERSKNIPFFKILCCRMSSQRNQHHLLCVGLIIACLTGAILAQTFTYSHGWTNGKKRASIIPFVFQDSSEGQEILGLCQMQRLREILQDRHRNQVLFSY